MELVGWVSRLGREEGTHLRDALLDLRVEHRGRDGHGVRRHAPQRVLRRAHRHGLWRRRRWRRLVRRPFPGSYWPPVPIVARAAVCWDPGIVIPAAGRRPSSHGSIVPAVGSVDCGRREAHDDSEERGAPVPNLPMHARTSIHLERRASRRGMAGGRTWSRCGCCWCPRDAPAWQI